MSRGPGSPNHCKVSGPFTALSPLHALLPGSPYRCVHCPEPSSSPACENAPCEPLLAGHPPSGKDGLSPFAAFCVRSPHPPARPGPGRRRRDAAPGEPPVSRGMARRATGHQTLRDWRSSSCTAAARPGDDGQPPGRRGRPCREACGPDPLRRHPTPQRRS